DVVVVGERDDRRTGGPDAGVASIRHAEPRLADVAHVSGPGAERVDRASCLVGRRVVDDDDFVPETGRDQLVRETVQRAREKSGSVVRADDDRYIWRMRSGHGAPLVQ